MAHADVTTEIKFVKRPVIYRKLDAIFLSVTLFNSKDCATGYNWTSEYENTFMYVCM